MKQSTEEIREQVNDRIRERAVIDNTLVDLRMELMLAVDESKHAKLQTQQQEYEQKLQENTAELEQLETEYQQAAEAEQQAYEALPSAGADHTNARLLRKYLEWVYEQCSYVSLAGIDRKAASREGDARLNLDDIYTALLTTSSEQEQGKRGRERDEPEEQFSPGREEKRLSAVAQLNDHARLVLLGDPGSGKSTFVNFVALCLAGEQLQQDAAEHYATLQDLIAPLPQEREEEGTESERQAWDHGALLPVRIILRDFAAWRGLPSAGEPLTEQHFWEFLSTQLRNASRGECLSALQTQLTEQGGLLLFDGLDEVSEAEQRREQIIRLVERCAGEFGHCRIVVTCRTYAYQEQQWRPKGFHHAAELARFTRPQIQAFVTRWYEHVGKLRSWNSEKIQDSTARLQHAIDDSERLYSFAERPLLLALMASLHAWRGGSLPEKREELYNDAVELLLDWWESQKVSRKKSGEIVQEELSLIELLDIDKDRLRQVLSSLAFDAHARQPELAGGTADIAEQDLVSSLLQVSRTKEPNTLKFVDYLSHRAGLLVPRGVGVYTFPHRTFQEYLAACHLTDQDDYPDNIAELARKTPNRWREVLLLAAAHASNVAPMIWALTEALCFQEPTENASIADAWGALLAAQALEETADLSRISSRNAVKFERVRHWLVAILTEQVPVEKPFPAVERALAGRLLAKLGDPRSGVGLREDGLPDLEWCQVKAGSFGMGDDGSHVVEFSKDFMMGRYPITNSQFQAFVDDGGYMEKWRKCWSDDGWKEKEEENWDGPRRLRDPFGFSNHPVVGVSWYETVAFCNWLTARLQNTGELKEGMRVRLPSEAEWEYAARGPEGYIYPWGNEPEPNPELANYDKTKFGGTSAVGCFPRGESLFSGCEEMAGNVWEWCLDVWHDTHEGAPPDGSARKKEDINRRLLKGGSWGYSSRRLRGADRLWIRRGAGVNCWGFRVVRAVGGQYSDF